jgi:hypothetical protein
MTGPFYVCEMDSTVRIRCNEAVSAIPCFDSEDASARCAQYNRAIFSWLTSGGSPPELNEFKIATLLAVAEHAEANGEDRIDVKTELLRQVAAQLHQGLKDRAALLETTLQLDAQRRELDELRREAARGGP